MKCRGNVVKIVGENGGNEECTVGEIAIIAWQHWASAHVMNMKGQEESNMDGMVLPIFCYSTKFRCSMNSRKI